MSDVATEWVSLSSGELRAEVNPLGAQLSTLRDGEGRDLLWDGDPAVWSGRAPLLFPIVGTLANGCYRAGGQTYRLPRHGFARGKLFDIIESTATTAAFRLKSDSQTQLLYPFYFNMEIDFSIEGNRLTVTTYVRNDGDVPMPASFGYHPAFRWPLPYGRKKSEHFIEFAVDEPEPFRRLDAAGLLTSMRHPSNVRQRRLALDDSLFLDDVVIYDEIRSRTVLYGADGAPRIKVSYPDAPYLGLWGKARADFICIEPWHGVADPAGFAGDFADKPGVFTLAPGGTLPIVMTIELTRA